MLLITAKPGETTTILTPQGELIELVICSTEPTQASIGLQAPGGYRILRKKLLLKLRAQFTEQNLYMTPDRQTIVIAGNIRQAQLAAGTGGITMLYPNGHEHLRTAAYHAWLRNPTSPQLVPAPVQEQAA